MNGYVARKPSAASIRRERKDARIKPSIPLRHGGGDQHHVSPGRPTDLKPLVHGLETW